MVVSSGEMVMCSRESNLGDLIEVYGIVRTTGGTVSRRHGWRGVI